MVSQPYDVESLFLEKKILKSLKQNSVRFLRII